MEPAESTESALELYTTMVYGIALTHTRDRDDANDVFQEVFLAYHRKQPDFNDEEHRKAWLIVTTINCARHNTDSSWRRKVTPMQDMASLQDAGSLGDSAAWHAATWSQAADSQSVYNPRFSFATEEQDQLFAAFSELPEKYRTVLHLFYFEDMAVKDIATALGIEAGTVKVQLSRGRALLRESLKGEYFDD